MNQEKTKKGRFLSVTTVPCCSRRFRTWTCFCMLRFASLRVVPRRIGHGPPVLSPLTVLMMWPSATDFVTTAHARMLKDSWALQSYDQTHAVVCDISVSVGISETWHGRRHCRYKCTFCVNEPNAAKLFRELLHRALCVNCYIDVDSHLGQQLPSVSKEEK